METNAVERSRAAIIGGVLAQIHGGQTTGHMSVLDVGCGEGAIVDFLSSQKKTSYVGVDLSSQAIKLARLKRGTVNNRAINVKTFNNSESEVRFVQSAAHNFIAPHHNFDVIIFSEVLYYTEYENIINQYLGYMSDLNGIMIISVFRTGDRLYPKMAAIFEFAREAMVLVDTIDIDGFIYRKEKRSREKTGFHIEVFRKKST